MAQTTKKSGSKRRKKAKKTSVRATAGPARKATRAPARKAAAGPRRAPAVIGVIAIVVMVVIGLAALAGGGYLWRQHAHNARVAGVERIDRLDARLGGLEARFDSLLTERADFGARLDNAERNFSEGERARDRIRAEMREEIRALSDSLAALSAEFGRGVERWSLEEAERLLVIANQRLQLAADFELAGSALKLADGRLRRLADPALGPVREMIAREIASLEGAATVDLAGALRGLSELSLGARELPLAGDRIAHAAAPPAPARRDDGDSPLLAVGRDLLADLGALVHIERDGKSPGPILSAELRRAIHEKTGLILESCQLAFLRRHGEAFTARMAAAENWVVENYDTESAEVGAWLERRAALAALSPEVEKPDISGSLEALREVMEAGN